MLVLQTFSIEQYRTTNANIGVVCCSLKIAQQKWICFNSRNIETKLQKYLVSQDSRYIEIIIYKENFDLNSYHHI